MGFQYDYFYRTETRQYKYFVIPQMLVLDEQFSALSDRAKILYCVMLDRSSMSAKNGWLDDQGRVYIIMARDEVMEKMCCSHTTAHKYMQELIDFGLIRKRRRGQGKPDWIYVMNFDKAAEPEASNFPPPETHNPSPRKEADPRTWKEGIPFLQEGIEPFLQKGREKKGKEPFLQEGKKPFPQEGKKPCLQEGKEPFLQEGKEPFLQEGKKPFPQEGKKPFPESDLYNNTNINKTSSSGGRQGQELPEEEDEYIKQYLGYGEALRKYPEMIVSLLYRELAGRTPAVWGMATREAFLALCGNVSGYHGNVANIAPYISRCVDNMLLAAAADVASRTHSPPSGKSRNQFNNFQQNTYDFALLEEKLLRNRERKKIHTGEEKEK